MDDKAEWRRYLLARGRHGQDDDYVCRSLRNETPRTGEQAAHYRTESQRPRDSRHVPQGVPHGESALSGQGGLYPCQPSGGILQNQEQQLLSKTFHYPNFLLKCLIMSRFQKKVGIIIVQFKHQDQTLLPTLYSLVLSISFPKIWSQYLRVFQLQLSFVPL